MRKTRRQFADRYCDEVLSGKEPEQAMLDAGRSLGWCNGLGYPKDATIVTKAKMMLANPDVLAAVREKIEMTTGFTTVESDDWLVKHIRGEIPIREGFLSPSLRALENYKRSTEPQPAKNVNIRSQSVVARITIGDDPPEIAARSLEKRAEPVAK